LAWPLTPPRANRISGLKNFRSSSKKDFFNTIRQKRNVRPVSWMPVSHLSADIAEDRRHLAARITSFASSQATSLDPIRFALALGLAST
jgi:hypothetical protein